MTTWRKEIAFALGENGQSWDDVTCVTLSDGELDVEFNPIESCAECIPFVLWTWRNLYFSVVYRDESIVVDFVRRDKCVKATRHVGGK